MPDVYDATRADGDADDDEAIIGDDLDDEDIVELSLEDEDEGGDDEDDYRASENLADDDDEAGDEVELSYAGDLNSTAGAHSGAQRYESRTLSDEDLVELGYKSASKEPKSFDSSETTHPEKSDPESKPKLIRRMSNSTPAWRRLSRRQTPFRSSTSPDRTLFRRLSLGRRLHRAPAPLVCADHLRQTAGLHAPRQETAR